MNSQITTIEQHIANIVSELDVSNDVVEQAYKTLNEYDDDVRYQHTPLVAAAGIVFTATCIENTKHTQHDVAAAAGVSRLATSNAYQTVCGTYEEQHDSV